MKNDTKEYKDIDEIKKLYAGVEHHDISIFDCDWFFLLGYTRLLVLRIDLFDCIEET